MRESAAVSAVLAMHPDKNSNKRLLSNISLCLALFLTNFSIELSSIYITHIYSSESLFSDAFGCAISNVTKFVLIWNMTGVTYLFITYIAYFWEQLVMAGGGVYFFSSRAVIIPA